jgi:hypothetical protein
MSLEAPGASAGPTSPARLALTGRCGPKRLTSSSGSARQVSPAGRPSSGLRAPSRGPLGSLVLAASRRAQPHPRASPSRVPRGRGRASGQRSGRSREAVSARPRPSAVSSSVPAIVTRPISRAVTSASTRLSRSSARLKIVRGWPCEVEAAPLRGRDGFPSLGENTNQGFWNELTGIGVAVCEGESGQGVEALEGASASCVDLLGEKTSTPTRPPTLQHAACCGIREPPHPLVGRSYCRTPQFVRS